MTTFTSATGLRPVNETHVADTAAQFLNGLNAQQNTGMDGLDVALGAISALRMFVLNNVGIEGVSQELRLLADVLRHGVEGE